MHKHAGDPKHVRLSPVIKSKHISQQMPQLVFIQGQTSTLDEHYVLCYAYLKTQQLIKIRPKITSSWRKVISDRTHQVRHNEHLFQLAVTSLLLLGRIRSSSSSELLPLVRSSGSESERVYVLWILLECLMERLEVEYSGTCRASIPRTAVKLFYVMFTHRLEGLSGGANASLSALLFSEMLYVGKSSRESQRVPPPQLDSWHISTSASTATRLTGRRPTAVMTTMRTPMASNP